MFFSKNGPFPDHSFFKQDYHLPISFFPFPSPFDVEDCGAALAAPRAAAAAAANCAKAARKRTCKKDRHSKITTARGLRDRRMRLSLPVARQFFGLQDMLGVDKGSKTVEWLLVQARPEIIKLAKERNYSLDRAKSVSSSTSEEIVSGIDEVGAADDSHKEVKKLSNGKEKKKPRGPRKTMAKELRDQARARARARTMEKLQIRDHEENYTKNHEKSEGMIDYQNPFDFDYLQQTESILLEEQDQFANPQFFS